jgi:hypothetical protein
VRSALLITIGVSLGTVQPACSSDDSDVRYAAEHVDLEVGVRYRYPLIIHCGMEWIHGLDGRTWRWVDGVGRDISDLRVPDDWPMGGWKDGPYAPAGIRGYVTLVDEDRLEYSIGGDEVIAVYEPTEDEAPACL